MREIARLWSFIELKLVARLLGVGLATTTIVAAAIAVGACGDDPSPTTPGRVSRPLNQQIDTADARSSSPRATE